MEISVLILSCVILGLNPVLPVLLYFFFFNFTICNLIWILPNKIHTYILANQQYNIGAIL